MNWIDLAVNAVAGFLVSLLVADGLRFGFGLSWPQQAAGLRFEKRPLPWLLALAAGPALLYDSALAHRRQGRASGWDLAAAGLVVALWSMSYGQCLAGLAGLLL